MLKTRTSFAAAAALAAMAFGSIAGQPTNDDGGRVARAATVTTATPKHGNKAPSSPEQRAAWLRVRNHRSARRRFGGLGWSVAHDRRMARKRRNVIKARRAKRG